uniref:Caspase family p20 domain-containing protein n=1 Tax=Amphimedon queenslandica TaxID=400682 RepID=A0A1X7STZ0_AMPQE
MASQVDTYQCEPGICLFINNTEFYGAGLADLEGGENDEASLRSTFENLGFDVRIRLNLTAAKMEFIAEEYSAMEHKGVFFLVISSHGGEGDIVYGTDGGE